VAQQICRYNISPPGSIMEEYAWLCINARIGNGLISADPDHRHNPDECVRSSRSRASVSRTDHPVRRHRPLRWRPGCRAAGRLDAVDDIAAIMQNAVSPVRDHGAPPVPLRNPRPSARDRRQDRSLQDRSAPLPGPRWRAAGRRVRAVRTVECPRQYTVLMVVDRQGADVSRHRARPLLGACLGRARRGVRIMPGR
jgi:hypothetical protein